MYSVSVSFKISDTDSPSDGKHMREFHCSREPKNDDIKEHLYTIFKEEAEGDLVLHENIRIIKKVITKL
jgi:hypothetical protein